MGIRPEWILASTRWQLTHHDDAGEWDAKDVLYEYINAHLEFLTPSGRDAVAVLLEDIGGDTGGDE